MMPARMRVHSIDKAEQAQRDRVVDIAHSWLRTPFHDGASIKGAGADCATFIKAVFEEAGLTTGIDIEAYPPQWYMHGNDEIFLNAIAGCSNEIRERDAIAADIVLYKFGRCFAHGGIVFEPGWPRIIHAVRRIGCVAIGEGNQGILAQNERGIPRERRFFRLASWAPPRSSEEN